MKNIPPNPLQVIHPLEIKSMPLNYAWKTLKQLNYVKRSEKYPKAFRRVHPHVLASKNEKWTNKILYKAVQDLRSGNSVGGDGAARLDEFQSRMLDVYELNSRLNGIQLNDLEMGNLKYFLHLLNEDKQQFRDLVQKHEEAFSSALTDPNDVADMPHSLLKALAEEKLDPTRGPWKVGMSWSVDFMLLVARLWVYPVV